VAESSVLPAPATGATGAAGAVAVAVAPWQEPLFYLGSPTPANLIAGTGYSRTVPLNPSGRTFVIVANRFI
jgi:hypothetical protein